MALIYPKMLFNFALEYPIRKVQGNKVGLGNNIDTIKKNTKSVIDTSKEVGQEIKTEN